MSVVRYGMELSEFFFYFRPCGFFLTNITACHTLKKSSLLIMKIFYMWHL